MKTALLGDRYQRLLMLGSGSPGDVWLAEDLLLVRRVAIKKLPFGPRARADAGAMDRMIQKAQLAADLRHPNAVAVYELITEFGEPLLVTEFIPGESLARRINRSGAIDPAEAARLVAQVAAALEVAHRAGIFHGCISPASLLIDSSGNAKLADFGIVPSLDDSASTGIGLLDAGTEYLAPEVALTGEATAAGDIWSLGATLYAAAEGYPPHAAGAGTDRVPGDGLARLDEVDPAPVRAPALAALLARMLARDPAVRPDAAGVRRVLVGLDPAELKTVSLISVLPDFGSTAEPEVAFEPLAPPEAAEWDHVHGAQDSVPGESSVVAQTDPDTAASPVPVDAGEVLPFPLLTELPELERHRRRRALLVAACLVGACVLAGALALAAGASSSHKPQAVAAQRSLAAQNSSPAVGQVVPVQTTPSSTPTVRSSARPSRSAVVSASPSGSSTDSRTAVVSTSPPSISSNPPASVVVHVHTPNPKPTPTPTPTVTSTPPPPPSVPGAPANLAWGQSPNDNTAQWSAPVDDGGAMITGYQVTLYDATAGSTLATAGLGPTAPGVYDFGCLSPQDSFYFTVSAINSAGDGLVATSGSIVGQQQC
jgi:serine/threonine protein kinase